MSTADPTPTLAVLVPISVLHAGQRVDIAVPASVPVAELLPGMVAALGRLTADAATQGFRAILPSGRELDQARSLADQDVAAGAVLTLETAGSGAGDVRYDDLVEAIGAAVEGGRTAWRRGDSVQLSAYTAAGLFAVAAALLLFNPTDPLLTAGLAVIGAALVTLSALVLVRIPVVGGAIALTLTAALLGGVAGQAFALWAVPSLRLAGFGLGVLLGAAAVLVLPQRWRAVSAAPVAVGFAVLVLGLFIGLGALSTQRAGGVVLAAVTLLVLSAPWIGLARIPARIEALSVASRAPIEAADVDDQVGGAALATLAVRIGAAVLTVGLTPLVAVDLPGALLTLAAGVAAMLGTRSLYGRAEVLVGVVGGLLTTLAAGATIAIVKPALLPWLAGAVIVVGAFVLAWNVVDAKSRPWLNRIADGVHVIALMAVLPLLVWILGLA